MLRLEGLALVVCWVVGDYRTFIGVETDWTLTGIRCHRSFLFFKQRICAMQVWDSVIHFDCEVIADSHFIFLDGSLGVMSATKDLTFAYVFHDLVGG